MHIIENEKIVQLLIDRGADVEVKTNDGRTLLHIAALAGNEKIIRLLMDIGADIKARNNNGVTLLHWAVLGGTRRLCDS